MKQLTFLLLFTSFFCKSFSQDPIPKDDADLEKLLTKLPAIEQYIQGCLAMQCAANHCEQMQAFQKRVRDARMYMKYMHFWLRRATEAHMEHLKNVAGESMMAADRAAKIERIRGHQAHVVSVSNAILELASAGSNFWEIATDPKILGTKTYREMAELFDKFYEGMKDAESYIGRVMKDRFDKDFPEAFANMIPGFGILTDDQMSDLKSHLSDIYSLMKAGVEYGGDWRKILKEGKGLASMGQIIGRFLKVHADSEIKERERMVDELLAGIIANNQVQSQTYKDLVRVQQRRNKAEDVYRAIEDLVVVSGSGKGGLTRCLMKHSSQCSGVDLDYTSRIAVPKNVDVVNFAFTVEEDKVKSYATALRFFNEKLPEVMRLLGEVPALPGVGARATLGGARQFQYKQTIELDFTSQLCMRKEAWVGIFPVFTPDVDDLAAGAHLVSGRARLEGKANGKLSFEGLTDGAYQARMFDPETGKAVATHDFIVGKDTYWLSGYYWNEKDKRMWKVEVYDMGFSMRFGNYEEGKEWKPFISGAMILDGGRVAFLNGAACGYGPGGTKIGEERDIPWRLVFSSDKKSFTVDHYKFTCDSRGKMSVTDQWVPSGWGSYVKK